MAMNSIERAVKAAGGPQALAELWRIKRQAVEKWVKHQRLPAYRVLPLEAVSGVSRHDLRPDLYPRDDRAA